MKRIALAVILLAVTVPAHAGRSFGDAPPGKTGRCTISGNVANTDLFACTTNAENAGPTNYCDVVVLVNEGANPVGIRVDSTTVSEMWLGAGTTDAGRSVWSNAGLSLGPVKRVYVDSRAARGWGATTVSWQCSERN